MPRCPDWPRRLHEYVEQRRPMPFAWGTNDCAHFAAGAVHAVTGLELRLPDAQNALSAVREVRLLGSLRDAAIASLGPILAPCWARRGDVVLLRQRGHAVLAVCLGMVWAAPGRDGLVFGPASDAVGCWRID